ncbi:MAG: TonB-dependent receptor plug domain-containing protein [Nitrospira sp. CR1.1]|nr:TonB-dependent receptor plug domain-containing protein [Nitrospira sp. CR1.1]
MMWSFRISTVLCLGCWLGAVVGLSAHAQQPTVDVGRTLVGIVQNQDLRRVAQASVEVKDQEGTVVVTAVANDAGEFTVELPSQGTYSVSARLDIYRSEYLILKRGTEPVGPVTLTLAKTTEISLEVVSPLAPIQYKASSETYALSRKEIEALPRGNNTDLQDVLLTIPSAVYGSLKQVHIRQDHANLQLRIDGVPIPDTVSSTFSDVISPRAWDRADVILGGMEAQYGNKAAAVLDITTKSGTKPAFGSVQMMGGSNGTLNPSFEYGGTVGEKFRFYILNSHTATNRGIEPPTLGHSVFHGQSERNQTFIRGDYQHDNKNNFTWLFLNSVAKYQIPTTPGLELDPSGQMLPLLQAGRPGFTPVASQAINEFQKENNQYGHMVWRHDVNANNFFSLAGYMRHTRATFKTDPLNVLAYTADPAEPFSSADQDRNAYSTGLRFDYTYVHSKEHLIKAGFQIDRTQSVNKTRLYTFADDGAGNPTGDLLSLNADNRQIGYRQEFWIQDQWSPNDKWTFNLGLRGDAVQYLRNEGQISPRLGATYKYDQSNVFHAFYGRMFTPPNLEAISFAKLNTLGTRAQPEDVTNNTVRAERAHYFEVGSYHALNRYATLQFTGWYKLSNFLSDAGQFGTTPLLNYFAFERGWQRGIDGALKLQLTDNLTARGNVAWGQCKGYGLQSGHFLLEAKEIADINSRGGVFCDHMQTLTSSAVVTYKFLERTTMTGQMLFASGLRSAENEEAKTNSTHSPSYTIYNLSIAHVFPLPWEGQKFLLGFDIINLLDQKYYINQGEGSIGLGVAHAGMPRSFFFRGQWFF